MENTVALLVGSFTLLFWYLLSKGRRRESTDGISKGRRRSVCAIQSRVPTHLSESGRRKLNSSGSEALLTEMGILKWRYSRAAREASDHTKSRARLFSRLTLLLQGLPLPSRGCTVVLVSKWYHCKDSSFLCALSLLATYYNFFVVFDIGGEQRRNVFDLLYGHDTVSEAVLPKHRVIHSSSLSGRVAFCRHLGATDLVIDFDPLSKEALTGFGHRVALYMNPGTQLDVFWKSTTQEQQKTIQ